jgi:hypothetical protein
MFYHKIMEEYSLTPKKNGWLKALVFLKMGVFEIGFVTAILLLLFGVLNYFNILSISAVFPRQLSWLPRQTTQTNVQTNSALKKNSALQNPTPAVFQYDVKKAETLVSNYIKDNIKPEFLPPKIEVKQGLSIDGRLEDIKYEFGSMFTANNASFSANFHYQEKTNTSNDFSIFIQPENAMQATATAILANSLLASYFTDPYNISDCQTKGTASFCENFQILENGKRGYGILLGNQGNKPLSIVFTCFVPKESKDYGVLKSCITP